MAGRFLGAIPGPGRNVAAPLRAELGGLGHPAAVTPIRYIAPALLALTFDRAINADLAHQLGIVTTLAGATLALRRAATKSFAVEALTATGAIDVEPMRADWQAVPGRIVLAGVVGS